MADTIDVPVVFDESQRELFQRMLIVCGDLIKKDEKPTVRKLIARLHSSPNYLTPLFRHWKKEQEIANAVDEDLSPTVKQAILAEFAHKLAEVRKQAKEMSDDYENQLNEAQEFLQESDQRNCELQDKMDAKEQEAQAKILNLEKRLSAAEASSHHYEQQLVDCQKKCEAAKEGLHAVEIELAKANTLIPTLEKQLAKLEANQSAKQ